MSSPTISTSLYTINYAALEAKTEEARIFLIANGFEAKELSPLEIKVHFLAYKVTEMLRPMLKKSTIPQSDQYFNTSVASAVGYTSKNATEIDSQVGRTSAVGETLILSILKEKSKEVINEIITLYTTELTPDEIDYSFITLHDPIRKGVLEKEPTILPKILQVFQEIVNSTLLSRLSFPTEPK